MNFLNIEYKYGSIDDIKNDNYKIIYSPSIPIDINRYTNKFFIFGPHFSVFPDEKFNLINFKTNNHIYIMPSKWCIELWNIVKSDIKINMKVFTFPVNTEKFNQIKNDRNKVMIYYKSRNINELKYLIKFLINKNIDFKIFNYNTKYNEEDFINYLHDCRYAIILDAHESQGFAIEEIMACNVPLLVWNVKFMSQELNSQYSNYPATTIPYWDDNCGEYFYEANELEEKFNIFITKLDTYKPRQFILDNLSVEKCALRFKNLFKQ